MDDLQEINQVDFGEGVTWTGTISHPATGASFHFPGKVIPADTFFLYAGGRNLTGSAVGSDGGYRATGNSQEWFDIVSTRGEGVTLGAKASDYGPWGGAVSFDTQNADGSPRAWNFSTTETSILANTTEFVPEALAVVAHALGIGLSDSWYAHVADEFGSNPSFTGPMSKACYGNTAVPLKPGIPAYWRSVLTCSEDDVEPVDVIQSRSIPSFGTPAGIHQPALLEAYPCPATAGFLSVFTELDAAALADIGWELPNSILHPNRLPQLSIKFDSSEQKVTLNWTAWPQESYSVQGFDSSTNQWIPASSPLINNQNLPIAQSIEFPIDTSASTKLFRLGLAIP